MASVGGETIIAPDKDTCRSRGNGPTTARPTPLTRLQGVHEVVPGIWAPDRIQDESISVRDDGASRLMLATAIQIVEYRPRQVPPAAAFRIEVPYGVDVTDRRLGYVLPQGSLVAGGRGDAEGQVRLAAARLLAARERSGPVPKGSSTTSPPRRSASRPG